MKIRYNNHTNFYTKKSGWFLVVPFQMEPPNEEFNLKYKLLTKRQK